MASIRTFNSSLSTPCLSMPSASPPPAAAAAVAARTRARPPESDPSICRSSWSSRLVESAAGARARSRPTRRAARAATSSAPSSPLAPGATHAEAFSTSITGTATSSKPKSSSCCAEPGRTVSKLTKAASNFAADPSMPGILAPGICASPPPLAARKACISGVAERGWLPPSEVSASPTSSRKAVTRGFVHSSSTAVAKASPNRSKLQTAPADRPQSLQFMGFSCRASAGTNATLKGAITSRKAGILCPGKHMFPRMLTASSAGLLLERPTTISSNKLSSASAPPASAPKRSDACLARSSNPGGSIFSFDSVVTASMRSLRCGSGCLAANSAMAFALIVRCDHSNNSSSTGWRHSSQASSGHTCLTAGAVSAQWWSLPLPASTCSTATARGAAARRKALASLSSCFCWASSPSSCLTSARNGTTFP
mmetsp:Transcript_62223/g.161415  ORF Transcript_62223/g.161415 Transcript_62223/m.161415 type:complete len:426 (-) Transcript_62223:183-1460(-)